ncbi:MAG: DUF4202 domain-containing protein [Deltaproteobacteria bacterium]|nr:DUF4202 domain-containing protein [Deltaproteobacteria bacterium]
MEPELRYREALSRFESAHREDPKTYAVGGSQVTWSLLYHERMGAWIEALAPDASESLRLAARCQHIRRWRIPRHEYPMDAAGYKRWRSTLGRFHADEAGRILEEVGYPVETIGRVKALLQKKGLKTDAEVQVLEDAICLVFLENEFSDFASKHDDAKVVDILRKTWGKMSTKGHETALSLVDRLPSRAQELIRTALATGT